MEGGNGMGRQMDRWQAGQKAVSSGAQKTADIDPMLFYCWTSWSNSQTALSQHLLLLSPALDRWWCSVGPALKQLWVCVAVCPHVHMQKLPWKMASQGKSCSTAYDKVLGFTTHRMTDYRDVTVTDDVLQRMTSYRSESGVINMSVIKITDTYVHISYCMWRHLG